MKIYSNSLFQNPNSGIHSSFKSKATNKKREEYQRYIEKQNYITSKTRELDDLSMMLLLVSFLLKAQDIDLSKKLKTKEWLAIGALGGSIAMMITSSVKHSKLSKEYDKEMNKERV